MQRLPLRFAALLLGTALLGGGCRRPSKPPPEPPPPVASPDLTKIPTGPAGDEIRRGHLLVTKTYETLPTNTGAQLHCSSCHLDAGTRPDSGPWIGLTSVFPVYRDRSGKMESIEGRINDCFERSLNGTAIDSAGADMHAIVAYMNWISEGTPKGQTPGRGFPRSSKPPVPNPEHGKAVYAARCAACHGTDGAGQYAGSDYIFPATWGPKSFNIGAGMARLDTAAAFVRTNMPIGKGGTLSEQDSYDVADFFIHQDRPDFAGKVNDWPKGGKPRDARY